MADCALDIISRLGKSFSNITKDREKPDFLTRDIGGHSRSNQPYVSGYFQAIFGLPEVLFAGADGVQAASKWLHSTVESFTPHNIALNKGDVMGQGQLGASFPTSITTTREISFSFLEYQNMPILNIIRRWASVFDPFTGVSPLKGNKFIPANYKGWVAVLQTKPVGSFTTELTAEDLEECYIYDGVFPTNIPVDTAAAGDINSNDFVRLQVQLSFDNTPLTSAEPGVVEKVLSLIKDLRYMGIDDSTYCKIVNEGTGNKIQPWGSHSNTSVTSRLGPDGGGGGSAT